MKLYLSLFLVLFISQINAQSLDELAADLSLYSDIVVNTQRAETRIAFQPKLKESVERFLSSPGSFQYKLDLPLWISVKDSEDGLFRLISWELNEDNNYQYFGYVQFADGNFLELLDQSAELEDIEYAALDAEFWFGSLYYSMISRQDEQGNPYYIAFGINRKDEFTTVKTAEVFSLVNGKLKLGLPVFKQGQDVKERLYLEYSADANVSLNYNPAMNLIIFDHLISRMGNMPGQGPTRLPDGSYSGYQYTEGAWQYLDKLYNQVSAEPPSDRKKSDKGVEKDLFGNIKKN